MHPRASCRRSAVRKPDGVGPRLAAKGTTESALNPRKETLMTPALRTLELLPPGTCLVTRPKSARGTASLSRDPLNMRDPVAVDHQHETPQVGLARPLPHRRRQGRIQTLFALSRRRTVQMQRRHASSVRWLWNSVCQSAKQRRRKCLGRQKR